MSTKTKISEHALEARMVLPVPDTTDGKFMYMPAGRHTVSLKQGNKPIVVDVMVTAGTADELNAQLSCIRESFGDHKPFCDFDHKKDRASFWPEKFSYETSPKPGVYVHGEWSASGKQAVEGKDYRGFSPVFWVDDTRKRPAEVVCNPDAHLNCGGLVNMPAFHENLPLWAKHAGATSEEINTGENEEMKNKIAELQAKQATLEQEITALKAKGTADTGAAAELSAKQSESRAIAAELRAAQAEEKTQALEAKETERRKKLAKDSVAAAVKRGAIAPQNTELQAKYTALIEQDETNVVIVEGLEGKEIVGGKRITHGAPLEAKAGSNEIIKALGTRLSDSRKIRGFDQNAREARGVISREIGALYAKEVAKNSELLGMPLYAMREALEAASAADTLGTLNGTLVLQRTLELFRINYPMFKAVYTDFSDATALLGQTVQTRIISKPAVQTYNKTLGADGRPAGWDTASAATTTDVPVSIDEHVGVPIVFDNDTLAKTTRRLFDEMSPAQAYALAAYFVAKVYSKCTAGNFNAYAAVNGVKVPTAYATYAKGIGDFGRNSAVELNQIFNQNEVPMHDRFMLLNSAYFSQAGKDPSLVTFWAGQRNPEIITEGELPKMSKFVPIEAPDFPAAGGGVGFAFQKNALIALSRLPGDYSKVLPGASYGNITQITAPETGMTVLLVEYVNHTGGYAEMRMELMIGAGVGDKRAGLLITQQ